MKMGVVAAAGAGPRLKKGKAARQDWSAVAVLGLLTH